MRSLADEMNRILNQDRITGRSLASEAAEGFDTFNAAKAANALNAAKAANALNAAKAFDMPSAAKAVGDLYAAKATAGLDVAKMAAGLDITKAMSDLDVTKAAIFSTVDVAVADYRENMAAAYAVLDHLKTIQAQEVANLRHMVSATIWGEAFEQSVRNSAMALDWQRVSRALGPVDELRRATSEFVRLVRGSLQVGLCR